MRGPWWRFVLMVAGPLTLSAQTTGPTTGPSGVSPAAGPATLPTTAPATRPAVRSFGDPDTLLRELASSDWHVRRQAIGRLSGFGVDAKPFIRELIDRSTDDEARKNAIEAVAQIDENRLFGTSYITLHVKNAKPSEIMAEISRQCFAPLLCEPANLLDDEAFPKLTLDYEHQPFWKVMPQVCQTLGLDLRQWQNNIRLMRAGGMQINGVSHIEGPFLVVANQISYSRTRFFGGRREQSQCGISLSVYAEPKLNVTRGGGSLDVTTAIDDHGNSLVPKAAGFRGGWGGFGGQGGWNLYAPLEYPARNPGTRIVKFSGATHFVVQVESQKVEIPDLANLKHTTKRILGMSVDFEDVKKNADAWQLHVRVDQPNFTNPEWQQLMDGLQNRMQILDSDGTALDHRGVASNANNTTINLTLDFAKSTSSDGKTSGDPARLVWEVPTKTRTIAVPIEFTDLPLFDDK